jgi:uncharacterized protein YecE (DUF72 family)
LLQFPPYVVPKPASNEYLHWATEQLPGDELLVEFRHRDWLAEPEREQTLAFLEELGATLVCVDAPPTGGKNVLPTVVALTSETAYVRLHGRNVATWNRRGGSAAERFDHLYEKSELAEWVTPLRELSNIASRVFVMVNTNGRSPDTEEPRQFRLAGAQSGDHDRWIAQAPANAAMLQRLLAQGDVPIGQPARDFRG